MSAPPICCATCVWSAVENSMGHRVPIGPDSITVLACRRHAPHPMRGFAWVADYNWCGDYFLRQAAQDALKGDKTGQDMSESSQ